MRASILVPLFLVGCGTAPAGALTWRSTLDATTKGVGLHADGTTGHAGMNETNCPFETIGGQVTGDQQLPGDGEEVQDVGPSSLGANTVLLVLDEVVYLLDKTTGEYVQDEFDAPGVREGRLTEPGTVILVGEGAGCRIEWTDDAHAVIAGVDLDACPADVAFDADRATGLAIVAGPAQVDVIDSDGTRFTAAVAGDRVAWDADAAAAYVATFEGTDLAAVEPDGTLRWSAVTDAPIAAIAAAGGDGGLLVATSNADGSGRIELRSADDGLLITSVETPMAATGLVASEDGSTIGVVRPEQVHFYVVTR
jgi:hypothetical protein